MAGGSFCGGGRIDLVAPLCHKTAMHAPSPRRFVLSAVLAAAILPTAMARADMLEGGLLGTLFRGDAFTGPRLIDIVVLGCLVFLVLRLVTGRSAGPKQPDEPRQPDARANQPEYRPEPPERRPEPTPRGSEPTPTRAPRNAPDMYTAAEAMWAALKSPAPKGSTTTTGAAQTYDVPPAGTAPDEEFLAGAKMAYGRILSAMAERDLDDLAQFTTPQCLARLKNSLPAGPAGRLDVLLVEASLAESREENGRTVNTVAYKALVREPGSPENTERHDRWRFIQDNATPGDHWRLDSMEG